jgi:hypothetical protein
MPVALPPNELGFASFFRRLFGHEASGPRKRRVKSRNRHRQHRRASSDKSDRTGTSEDRNGKVGINNQSSYLHKAHHNRIKNDVRKLCLFSLRLMSVMLKTVKREKVPYLQFTHTDQLLSKISFFCFMFTFSRYLRAKS